jgi:hypothetical protein
MKSTVGYEQEFLEFLWEAYERYVQVHQKG